MLASIRSKTGGACGAVLCCRVRGDAAALLTVSKPKEKGKNRSPSSEYTRLINLFECNLVPGWRCLVLLFCAQQSWSGALSPKLACQARARTAKLEDFALSLRPSSFRVTSPRALMPRRRATTRCSLALGVAVSFPGPSE